MILGPAPSVLCQPSLVAIAYERKGAGGPVKLLVELTLIRPTYPLGSAGSNPKQLACNRGWADKPTNVHAKYPALIS